MADSGAHRFVVRPFAALLLASIVMTSAALVRAAAPQSPAPVTVADDGDSYRLGNEFITAHISKSTGTFSLDQDQTRVIERGYWSQVGRSSIGDIGAFGTHRASFVRIDPKTNHGKRAQISCIFGYENRGLPCDVEMRYALGAEDHGLFAEAIWTHKTGYPAFSVGEARMALKLNPKLFDFLAIDENRLIPMPSGADWDRGEQLNMKEVRRITTGPFAGRVEHKYDYSAILAQTPAYGWVSTKHKVGVWLINPSIEYLAGGPTKVELTGHLDVNPGGAPVLLNMWHGSHYGGSSLAVAKDESWTKTIGPFLIYCNAGTDPKEIWQEAVAHAKQEQQKWPYDWAADNGYPPDAQRGTVTGTLAISDPLAPKLDVRNLQVGLAAAPYTPAGARSAEPVDWQRDCKHYQFWTRADSNGHFTISHVRPGSYTLNAFADGVLGEFRKANITVAPGESTQIGRLTWTPVRRGRQLWEIGIPNRSAEEFRHGDDYWHWGLYYQYPKEFPHDVNFVIGQSDWRRDWNYCQPPRIEGNHIQSTTWSITFNLSDQPKGKATLRLAFAGSRGRGGIDVAVNGTSAGNTGPLPDTGVMHRDGIRGYWFEREVPFDAALLKAGQNVLTLTPRAKSWVDGVLYDYLRLELDDTATR